MVQDGDQEVFVKLKCWRKLYKNKYNSFFRIPKYVILKKPAHLLPVSYLSSQLPNAVDKLDKNRRAVSICVVLITMSDTLREISEIRTLSGGTRRFTCHWKCWKWTFCLPAGSGDQSSAILSPATPQIHEWCGNNRPAWAWPKRWAGSSGPSHRCSAPPPRSSQTQPCLQSAELLRGSATKKEKREKM